MHGVSFTGSTPVLPPHLRVASIQCNDKVPCAVVPWRFLKTTSVLLASKHDVAPHAVGSPRCTGDMTMTDQQQQALDSFYAIDNVLTVKITMPQADWDAVRTEQPKGGVCNFEWTGGARYTWRKATSVEISGTRFPATTTFADVGVKKKSFCGSINSDKPCLHVDFGKFGDANVPGDRGPDRVPLRDTQQLHSGSVLHRAAAGLHVARDGRAAAFAMQFRPGVRERNADRPRRRRCQQPRHLRQRRADHEALHRAQLQRQHEGQPVRVRASRRLPRARGCSSSAWRTCPSSRTRPI